MRDFFKNLFEYNNWANTRMIDSLKVMEGKDKKSFELASHLVDAQINWLHRILDASTAPQQFWNLYGHDDLNTLSKKSIEYWLKFIDEINEEELSKNISYVNSKGERFTNTIQQIMTHVINHSTYHRAQVAAVVRQQGHTPAVTDYIVYCRQKRNSGQA